MKVLVACEESQRVCIEFRKLGHEAYSCDIQECSGNHPEWHIIQDVLPLLNGDCSFTTCDGIEHTINGKWDLIVAHPPCTFLSCCCNRAYSLRCTPIEKVEERKKERKKAASFFMEFVNADCKHILIENPVGYMNTHYRKADQIIHPYYFATDENDAENYVQKKTCLWLKNLPLLQRSTYLPKPPPKYICQGPKSKGKNIGWCEGMRGVTNRAKARSKTFVGIAKAIVEQYSKAICNPQEYEIIYEKDGQSKVI